MRAMRATTLGLLLTAGLAGCATQGGTTTQPHGTAPTGEATQAAQALYTKGQFDQAAQAYLALANQDSDHRDYFRLLAAESYRQEGALDRAAPVLGDIRRSRLEGEDALRFDALRAELALKKNDPATALSLTGKPSSRVSPQIEQRLTELHARAQAASGDPWSAAQTRVDLDGQLRGIDREQNRKEILALLTGLGAEPLATRGNALPANDPLRPWVLEAQTQLGSATRSPAVLDQAVGTVTGDKGVREGYKVPTKVALLLPLTGPLAGAGAAIRDGFFANYIDAAHTNAPRPEVAVYDSGNDASHAVAAYDKAVSEGARFVVGPLNRDGVSAIFAKGALPAPMLTLNYPNDNKNLPPSGANEFGLLPETEGAQVADHMADRGLHSAVVIVSTDDFARRAGNAFKAEWQARGGKLAGQVTLDATSIDFASQLSGAGIGATPEGDTDGGVFLSMKPQQARLLMPQLRLTRNTQPVFATSHVYTGSDDAAADRDLEGVEFCDAPWLFDAQPGLPRRADLAGAIPATRGVAARLFAFGMDAWGLVPYIDWMRGHPGSYLPGATGQLVADEFGRVRRVLIWARFTDGVARPVAGSLELEAPATAPTVESGGG
ncbi:penicillin-binding protein activator [Luteibacter anthropi]|uniref:ABC transporter substrate-binding protein n=1 Tax=Luteibacter anthropi TaxID=564369 RepID=A0A7X5UEY7_9GAMM|nr:penicillin-binding protein activator [Luteibacter anthropi]NII09008.1 ABC transporter substrate-binding protein [Luteibacter anthropi]URX64434.1 penicillin-binding protein activator [Luteibacter anthropi]